MGCSPWGCKEYWSGLPRILEWVAISFSRRSSQPRARTQVSCIAGRFFFPPEPPGKPKSMRLDGSINTYLHWSGRSFPGGASGKESTCQGRRHKRHGFNPWVGKIPWRRAWQPTPVFLPRESHGQRTLMGYSP